MSTQTREWYEGTLAQVLLLLAAIGLVYSNAFTGNFQLDDYHSILLNTALPNLRNLPQMLLGESRPIPTLVNALSYAAFGLNPVGYHVTNVLIHWVACVFLLLLLRRAFAGALPAVPVVVCLFFAVHPVNTMAVTYIVQGRTAALAAAFCLGSLWFFDRYALSGRWLPAMISLVLFALGLATKENAAPLPLALLAWDRLIVAPGAPAGSQRTRTWFHGLSFGLLVAAVGLFLWKIDPMFLGQFTGQVGIRDAAETVPVLTPWRYLITQLSVVLRYLRLIAVPTGQSVEYHWPVVTSFAYIEAWGSLVLLLAFAGGAGWFLRRSPAGLFGLAWCLLFLLPESSFVPLEDVIYEHRAYLPFAGGAFALAGLLDHFLRQSGGAALLRRIGSKGALAAAAVVLVVYGVTAHARNEVWQSNFTLYADAYQKNSGHPRVRANLMTALVERGDYMGALKLNESLPASYQQEPVVQLNVALALKGLGAYREAAQILVGLRGVQMWGIAQRADAALVEIEAALRREAAPR